LLSSSTLALSSLLVSHCYRYYFLSVIFCSFSHPHPLPSSFLYPKASSQSCRPIVTYYHSIWTNHVISRVSTASFAVVPDVQHTHVRVGFSDYKLLIHAATDNLFLLYYERVYFFNISIHCLPFNVAFILAQILLSPTNVLCLFYFPFACRPSRWTEIRASAVHLTFSSLLARENAVQTPRFKHRGIIINQSTRRVI